MLKSTLLFSVLLLGSALAGGAGAQSTAKLPVNQFTTLPKSGTDSLAQSAKALQATLTELQALQLQPKQAQWNVSGTLYFPLHELLQEHYGGVAKYADDVAERLLSVGSSSDGRAGTIVQTSNLPEIPGGFIDDIEKVDPTSANLLQEVEHGIEKYQWQMRAHFQPTATDANSGADINGGKPVALSGKYR